MAATPDLLISDLYAAANGRHPWTVVLNDIANYLDLWTVQVLGVDKRNGHLTFSTHGGRATPQTALDYFRSYNAIDPRVAPTLATPQGQWMHCHELFDENYVAQSIFYQDFLIPHGGRYVSATTLIDNNEVGFILAMMRGAGSRPLGSGDMVLLNQIRHHMTGALQNMLHIRESYAELGMARELLAQFNYPMLLIDETRGIWHRNPAAVTLLAQGDVVAEQGGFLTCRDKGSDSALTEAIYSLQLSSSTASNTSQSKKRAVSLKKTDGSPCLAFISAIRPEQTMGAFGHSTRALVIFHDPGKNHAALDPFIVAESFEFTPAEARVAIQIVAGKSVKEIAKKSGVALTTVRTQLQRIMVKTDVTRQADLIRVLLALPSRAL